MAPYRSFRHDGPDCKNEDGADEVASAGRATIDGVAARNEVVRTAVTNASSVRLGLL
jgi:hypothetical protein